MNDSTLLQCQSEVSHISSVPLRLCLKEVSKGAGALWRQYRILGATRDGLAIGKEGVGKHPERYKPIIPGTIFYNPMRILIGSIAMLDEGEEPGITSPDYVVFRCNEGKLHYKFFYYWLRSSAGANFIRRLARGAVRERMLFKRLITGEILLPPWQAQQEFAKRMSIVERAQTAEADRQQYAEALPDAILRAAFHHITPLCLDSRQAEQAPHGWHWVLLTRIARLESGHTPSRDHPEWWAGPIPWIALPDIRALDGKVALETSEYTNEDGIANSSARILPAGTVVLSRTASVGFVTIMGRPMATSQDFVNWVCGPELDPWFLVYLLMASRRFIRQVSSGAIHKTVYMPTVKGFRVCIPSITEQRRLAKVIGEQLAATERIKTAASESLEFIGTMPSTLLKQTLNGAG